MDIKFEPVINEKTILIVDDSNIIRNLIENIYKDNYKILMAETGRGAIDIIDVMPEGSIVAVLLDLNMPDLNGFDVLEHIRQKDLFKTMPVSIITGEENDEVLRKARGYDIVDVLIKPFSANEIEKTVTKMIDLQK